ncbi:MAG: hypothetical protein QW828_06045, partial [Candidatus Bathyarchaeia archaeon]
MTSTAKIAPPPMKGGGAQESYLRRRRETEQEAYSVSVLQPPAVLMVGNFFASAQGAAAVGEELSARLSR